MAHAESDGIVVEKASDSYIVQADTVDYSSDEASYEAYICWCNDVWSMRLSGFDEGYGKGTPYLDTVLISGYEGDYPEYSDSYDADIQAYAIPATITDAVITGNGTYTVSVEDFDWSIDGASSFNSLYINTDIPVATYDAYISSAKLIVDGKTTAALDCLPIETSGSDYIYSVINIWSSYAEEYTGPYPTESLAIEFTVEGLPEPEYVEPEAPKVTDVYTISEDNQVTLS